MGETSPPSVPLTSTQPAEGLTSIATEIIGLEEPPDKAPPATAPLTADLLVLTPALSVTLGYEGPLRNHPELRYRDLLEDPIALLTSIVRESYKPKSYNEAISKNNPNSDD